MSIRVDRHRRLLAHIHAAAHNHQYITAQHRQKQPPPLCARNLYPCLPSISLFLTPLQHESVLNNQKVTSVVIMS
ncbi:hypothetical protein KSS87_010811 [Heliosperma pusillum]|nr:hypothetical protein KSS87_010811 [Heliosperma pusillum]